MSRLNYKDIEFKCEKCSKTFRPTYSQMYRYKKTGGCRLFCSSECYLSTIRGAGNPKWRGGFLFIDGYKYIYSPEHPNRTKLGYVAEHRLVMESKIGRYLTRSEVVHHIDKNSLNNSESNLLLLQSEGEHRKLHMKYRTYNEKGVFGHKEGILKYV